MESEPSLVLAMPRRELFRIHGFVPPVDIAVLESLADESWYASRESLSGSFDAKEVRVGVVILKAGHVLVSDGGVLLHTTAVPPEAAGLGHGLVGLRNLALAASRQLLGIDGGRIELRGFCNEDALPECRGIFILVYSVREPDGTPAPEGMGWAPIEGLGAVPLDPVSALVVEVVR